MKLCAVIWKLSCLFSVDVAIAYTAGIPIPSLLFSKSCSSMYTTLASHYFGPVESVMWSTGISSSIGVWLVSVFFGWYKASAAWCFVHARWGRSDLNSEVLSQGSPRSPVKSVRLSIHLSAPWSEQRVNRQTSEYDWCNKTAHTSAGQCFKSFALSPSLDEHNQYTIGLSVPSDCFCNWTQPICNTHLCL